MGICASSLSLDERLEISRNRTIEEQNAKDHAKDDITIKLLLLGAGESGKSTIFKQMKLLYGQGFTDNDRRDWVPKIRMGAVSAMKAVCAATSKLGLDISPNSVEAFTRVTNADERAPLSLAIANSIKILWQDQSIKETWKRRSEYQVIESNEKYFDQIDVIASPDYSPTDEDILGSRVRTCGIVEEKYVIETVDFVIIDVGGQRNERKKWIHCFENVNALIFVAALSEFDQAMFEDESQNRMVDALHLFDSICNSRWFQKTAMILFLNKRDLFARKIIYRNISDVVHWQDYEGKAKDYDAGVRYFQCRFLDKDKKKEKDIYSHVTCATDTENVKIVFDASKDIILKFNLEASGFM